MDTNSKKAILFEGNTLEDAYKKASLEFNCSLVDLDSEVIQTPRDGILGVFARNAIIKVYPFTKSNNEKTQNTNDIKIEEVSSKINEFKNEKNETIVVDEDTNKDEKIFDEFYEKKKEKIITIDENTIEEIQVKVNDLFKTLCYDIEDIKVSVYDDNTIYFEFSGNDAALLIGKEGYRYKALSYIIFNWIHDKYNKMVRIEVAEFLQEQEKSVKRYLEPVIKTIKEDGFYKTKTFDGILVHIALSTLREEFPNKYVAVKVNQRGEKYIIVNDYKK